MPPDTGLTSPPLFGREPDLSHLANRINFPGVTAVIARAQMGKTSLLREFAARLRLQPSGVLLTSPLVGSAESSAETPDLLLRAVSDLYTQWIASTGFSAQAGVLSDQQNHDLIGRAGVMFGGIFKALAGLGPEPVKAAGDLVKSGFDAAAAANRDLKSGGIQLERLEYDQARDLLALVYRLSSRPLVLILDQWELSPDPAKEYDFIARFLKSLTTWPPCHIILGVRAATPPAEKLKSLAPGFLAMECNDLPPMHLETPQAATPLLHYLHAAVPVTGSLADAALLDLIDGYPGTVARWVSARSTGTPLDTVAQLTQLAADANVYHFAEFDTIFDGLEKVTRRLAMRLVLLPTVLTREAFKPLLAIARGDSDADDLDILKDRGILETISPPSYGHGKRVDAAREWFFRKNNAAFGETTQSLVLALGSSMGLALQTGDFYFFASAIAPLKPLVTALELDFVPLATCEAARSTTNPPDLNIAQLTHVQTYLDPPQVALAPMLAAGLVNARSFAVRTSQPSVAAGILDDLRQLALVAPSPSTRGVLSMALFNETDDQLKAGGPTAMPVINLIAEMEALAAAFPAEVPPARNLALGLFNRLLAYGNSSAGQRTAIVDRLRELANSFPQNSDIQKQLASALGSELMYRMEIAPPVAPVAMLEELIALIAAHPAFAGLRTVGAITCESFINLTRGWMLTPHPGPQPPTGSPAGLEADFEAGSAAPITYASLLALMDGALENLRVFAEATPPDPAVDVLYARALANLLGYAYSDGNSARQTLFFDRLQTFVHRDPQLPENLQLLASVQARIAQLKSN